MEIMEIMTQWDGLRMSPCNLCPRECGADRTGGQLGYCREDDRIFIARAALHMWEEPCISGERGSGTVFFAGCNLRCIYCQNHEIAAGGRGRQVSTRQLAEIFLELQAQGAANINLVTPDHYVIGVAEAVLLAKGMGLKIPIVYNCSGYAKSEVIENLSGIVDVFLTDFKYMDADLAARYSAAPDYPDVTKKALQTMVDIIHNPAIDQKCLDGEQSECEMTNKDLHVSRKVYIKQEPTFDDSGMMQRGVIVRHLLLPGHKKNARDVIKYIYETYGDRVCLSLMNQYTPFVRPEDHPSSTELCRKVTAREYASVVDYAIDLGVRNAFIQEGDTAKESFVPEFDV